MAQFDVFYNLNHDSKKLVPFLVDLQANLLNDYHSRVVAPLSPIKLFGKTAKFLNPVFIIENEQFVMITTEIAGVSTKILGKKVTSLIDYRNDIINALDFLFTGI